ncbi:LysM domain-containing protein [Citrus sinensis]|nr:LysM domain-containing protein [Citrus sinensis]
MFALKTLHIPLPGRHPPSPSLSDGSSSSGENSMERTPPRLGYSNILQSLESLRTESSKKGSLATGTSQKVSSAMSNLQKYYGLRSPNGKGKDEGTEMAVYRTGSSGHFDNGLFPKASPVSHPFASLIHKSKSLVNGFLHENGATDDYVPLAEAGEGEGEKSNEKSVRRRQKAEADSRVGTPERLLKEENSGGSSGFSPATGKGLAMRPKSASRTSTSDSESGWLSSIPVGLGDSIMTDGPVGVRKSSSTPSFIDQDSSSSSIWPTSKWSLKPDLQALSTVAITRPIFDGLPKPSRRGKAALD